MTDPATLFKALDDPVTDVEVFFGAKTWDVPQTILRELEEPEARVIAYGCHSSGKTHIGVCADFRHVKRHRDGRIIAMAPTGPQLTLVYWAEARTIHANMAIDCLPPINKDYLAYPGQPKRGIVSVSTDKPERLRGLKGGRMRLHIEEINGVREEQFPEIDSMFASANVSMYATMNPTRAKGPAFDMVTAQSHLYQIHKIPAWITPNLSTLGKGREEILDAILSMPEDRGGPLDENVMPFLISRRYVRDMWSKCNGNENHPQWLSRIESEFPSMSDDLLLDLAWIDAAEKRPSEAPGTGKLVAWIDVAGGGRDQTALCIAEHWWDELGRKRVSVIEEHAWDNDDARGDVIRVLKKHEMRWPQGVIAVDMGGLGHFWPKDLRAAGLSNVIGANYGHAALDPNTHKNYKASLFWNARDAFERGEVEGLTHGSVSSAQLSTIKWGPEKRYGLICIQEKDSNASPDQGEAVLGAVGWSVAPANASTGSWADGDGLSVAGRSLGREW